MAQMGITRQKIFMDDAVMAPIHATTPQDLISINPGWVGSDDGGVVEFVGMDLGGLIGEPGPGEGLPFPQLDVTPALRPLVHGHVGLEDATHGGGFISPA